MSSVVVPNFTLASTVVVVSERSIISRVATQVFNAPPEIR